MSDLGHRLAGLSPEKRALLERRLMELVAAGAGRQAIPRRGAGLPRLSFAQERLWFLDRLEPDRAVYNIARAARLRGRLDEGALRQALEAIVGRHEALRTTFAEREGEPAQVIAEAGPVALPVIDLRGGAGAERDGEVRHIAAEEARRPFDLVRGPLLRAALLHLGDEAHVLLLTMHHIVSDGWSLGVLNRELGELYGAFSTGRPARLPELPIQYADYAEWQRRWLQGAVLEAQLAYWRRQLAGAPAVLELPSDRPHPALQTYRGARHVVEFPGTLADGLAALSRRAGVTLFMTLLAGFQALLHRYTGQKDIVVGSPVAARTRTETEGLIGLFVNTLALRADLSGDPTFWELLGRVREVALGAYAHQDLPFEKLVEELNPARDLSRTPVFQVMFQLQNAPLPALALPGLTVSPLKVHSGTAKFDLTLTVDVRERGLRGVVEHNTDLFDGGTIGRMMGHFQRLLAGLVADPSMRVSRLPLLSDTERRQLLVGWNATEAAYPQDACLHELIEEQAEQAPEAVVVVCEGAELTYGELNRRANQLAHSLRGRGVGPEVLVGICLERSLDMVVGVLGVLKAGGAYVPLDPAHPRERLAFLLEDTRAPVLLTQERLVTRLFPHRAHVVCVDADWEEIARQPGTNPAGGVTPDNPAYVIYTSGSTGRPKGVMVPHRALVNFLEAMRNELRLTPEDVLLAVTTLSFDIAGLELFLPLAVGARVEVVSQAVAADGARLAERLGRSGATVLQGTPATWRLLLAAGWRGSPHLKALCGGEALSPELADQLLDRCGALWNLYGPTETTIWSTLHRVERGAGPVPIGRPIANTQCYVLDRHLEPVPAGVPGELYVGGAGLARGYLNRLDLTAERFVPDPFRPLPGARLYRTGDMARYRQDGTLEFLGRRDHQVKLRGFRIELGEIETVLAHHSRVREAVVTMREDAPGGARLVAYVVPRDGRPPQPDDLRAFLKRTLPEYMLPAAFEPLEALPLTPSGKVDGRALPAPGPTRPLSERRFIGPRDDLERELARIWQDTLGTAPIGVTDDFFDLGGHSLLAVRLVARIEKKLGRQVPLAALFQGRTIAHLADVLRWDQGASPLTAVVAIQPYGSRPPLYVGGSNPRYVALARYLGMDQPFYGLDVYALQGQRQSRGQRPYTCIEEIAACFADEIRALQPVGPYHLAGGCEGGIVAFEIAQQLRRRGERVALVSIWETPAPGRRGRPSLRRTTLFRVARQMRSDLRGRSLLSLGGKELLILIRHEAVEYRILRAMRRYRPRPYDGTLVVVRAAEQPPSLRDPALGWEALATAGIRIYTLPGSHHTWLMEHTAELASVLRTCLDEARGIRP
ncbi:MAG: amino acid adenylation domain-containing protein [Candidatus Rokubacteria bacterium]|nr:amino acid adenylation domain-containing protein [Candidatus Rokubacteria bacterium]